METTIFRGYVGFREGNSCINFFKKAPITTQLTNSLLTTMNHQVLNPKKSMEQITYPLVSTSIAGWNITIFNCYISLPECKLIIFIDKLWVWPLSGSRWQMKVYVGIPWAPKNSLGPKHPHPKLTPNVLQCVEFFHIGYLSGFGKRPSHWSVTPISHL